MEDILQWRTASHSMSQCCVVAVERRQRGRCRDCTLTLKTCPGPQMVSLFTAQQFSSSLLTCGQESTCTGKMNFNRAAMSSLKKVQKQREACVNSHVLSDEDLSGETDCGYYIMTKNICDVNLKCSKMKLLLLRFWMKLRLKKMFVMYNIKVFPYVSWKSDEFNNLVNVFWDWK